MKYHFLSKEILLQAGKTLSLKHNYKVAGQSESKYFI